MKNVSNKLDIEYPGYLTYSSCQIVNSAMIKAKAVQSNSRACALFDCRGIILYNLSSYEVAYAPRLCISYS